MKRISALKILTPVWGKTKTEIESEYRMDSMYQLHPGLIKISKWSAPARKILIPVGLSQKLESKPRPERIWCTSYIRVWANKMFLRFLPFAFIFSVFLTLIWTTFCRAKGLRDIDRSPSGSAFWRRYVQNCDHGAHICLHAQFFEIQFGIWGSFPNGSINNVHFAIVIRVRLIIHREAWTNFIIH